MAGTGSRLLDQLMDALRCLPGVGPRSAQRIAYHLLQRDREGGRRLARALDDAMFFFNDTARTEIYTGSIAFTPDFPYARSLLGGRLSR